MEGHDGKRDEPTNHYRLIDSRFDGMIKGVAFAAPVGVVDVY